MTAGRTSRRLPVILLLVTTMFACAHSGFVAGLVALEPETGPDARVQIVSSSGERLNLEGEGAEELCRIPGAIVRVTGEMRGPADGRRLRVESYRIIDAGQGVPPHVGVLRWEAGRLLLVESINNAILELIGGGALDLRAHVGARVWVVGPILGKEKLEVLNYGILRPAGS